MSDADERMQILEMIASGKITADQGNQLLAALNSTAEAEEEENLLEAGDAEAAIPLVDEPSVQADELAAGFQAQEEQAEETFATRSAPPSLPPSAARWRSFWMIPLWIGVGITILGGYWMYSAQMKQSVGWFICASMPFLLGVLVIALAAASRTSPWLHLRVKQKEGERPQNIAFSFPIPVRPAAWALRTFGHRIKGLQDTAVDEVIMALGTSTSPDNPLYIQVDEGDDDEKVEIFIG
jgi:hypothetical protein